MVQAVYDVREAEKRNVKLGLVLLVGTPQKAALQYSGDNEDTSIGQINITDTICDGFEVHGMCKTFDTCDMGTTF